MWIGNDRSLKARFLDSKEDTIEEEEEKKDREKKNCLLNNKTLKLTIVKKRKNKCLKGSIKSN